MDETILRTGFKYLNKFMVFMWKSGLGKVLNIWPPVFGRFLVITHYGRKTGNKYLTPVNYSIVDGEIYCTSGFGYQSDWYQNLIHRPDMEVWLPNGWWRAKAEDVTSHPDQLKIMREVLIGSGFAAYLFGINPHSLSDEALAELTKEYRLIRIDRNTEKTGENGPGEYAWIWHVSTIILFLMLLLKKRKK